MPILVKLFAFGLIAWFAMLMALIAMRALNGDIFSTGFLENRIGEGIAPERALMMAVFPAVIVAYAYNALTGDLPIVNGRASLPDVSQNLLALLTGGNSVYLAGKIARR